MNVRRWFKKLGIPLWAKLFVNLRASLITDLLDKYQQYFVCKWLGNTPNVADKYYRMITPEHIAVAAWQGDSKIANEIATKNGNENVNFSPDLVTFHANMQSRQLNEKKPYLQAAYGFKSENSYNCSFPTRTRTLNILVNSEALYRWSYYPICFSFRL